MINFVNKLDLSDQKYQANGNVRDESYMGNLFPMKDFVSFVTDFQEIYFMLTIFLKYSIDGVRVPQFKLAYICNITHPSHIFLIFVVNYIICGGEINIWNYSIWMIELSKIKQESWLLLC